MTFQFLNAGKSLSDLIRSGAARLFRQHQRRLHRLPGPRPGHPALVGLRLGGASGAGLEKTENQVNQLREARPHPVSRRGVFLWAPAWWGWATGGKGKVRGQSAPKGFWPPGDFPRGLFLRSWTGLQSKGDECGNGGGHQPYHPDLKKGIFSALKGWVEGERLLNRTFFPGRTWEIFPSGYNLGRRKYPQRSPAAVNRHGANPMDPNAPGATGPCPSLPDPPSSKS